MNSTQPPADLGQVPCPAIASPHADCADLLEIDQVLEQEDINLLKAQLAVAHQLLHYRQGLVDTLSEQMQFQAANLDTFEQQVNTLSQENQSQALELAEMKTICTDLRSQLKLQNRRQLQEPQILTSKTSRSLGFQVQPSASACGSVSFGYESAGKRTELCQPLTKAPPVRAWSAPRQDEPHEKVNLYQKLTTFMVASSDDKGAPISADEADRSVRLNRDESARRPQSYNYSNRDIALPRFARD